LIDNKALMPRRLTTLCQKDVKLTDWWAVTLAVPRSRCISRLLDMCAPR